ncbi:MULTISPECIES: hypothetical protein [Priestia]|uniref:hypothetical protein n=1 Tax=Priestia TaxID=2800373 RepID=UPI000BFA785E|nr:hypothetical protein [Priestia megaterium]PFI93377.1 hypothetical protein COI84_19620 [Priestia megaterium]PGR11806.1 hypothetical protein COC62_14380 [Priestia megaterium]
MNIIQEYLYNMWNEEGIVPELNTIEEALENDISHDEALDIPIVTEYFMQHIRAEEGEVLYEGFNQIKKSLLEQDS